MFGATNLRLQRKFCTSASCDGSESELQTFRRSGMNKHSLESRQGKVGDR